MATAYEIQVTEAYIGLLGRAPDPAGLAYWVGQLSAAVTAGQDATLALKKLTNDIANSPEYTAGAIGTQVPTTGNPSQTQADAIVNGLYQNLFDRDATQADKDYWTPQLTGGSTTAPEMTLNLITAAKGNTAKPADGEVLGYKQSAATYYVENVVQADFNRETAGDSVKDVNGPVSLATSKTATDAISTGVGTTFAFTTATDTVAVTGGDEVVTGVYGAGATYAAADTMNDRSTTDSDSLTLSGDGDLTFGTVANVETVSVSHSARDTAQATFDIAADALTGGSMTLTMAETVSSGGVNVAGEQTVSITDLDANLTTVNVKSLTVTLDAVASQTFTLDNDAATVDISAIDANDTTVTLANNDVAFAVSGTTAANDAMSVTADNEVTITHGAQDVELLTLAGSNNDVVFTMASVADSTKMVYTTAGANNITLAGDADGFASASFTDGSTGTVGLKFTAESAATAIDNFGVLDGGIDLASDNNYSLNLASGNTVTNSVAKTAAITLNANDSATDSSVTVVMGQNTTGINFDKFETVTITGNDSKATSTGDLDADSVGSVTVSGANDITLGAVANANAITVTSTGEDVVVGAITATNEVTMTSGKSIGTQGIAASNDITLTAGTGNDNYDTSVGGVVTLSKGNFTASGDDVNVANTLTVTAGNIALTSTGNDVDLENVVTATAGTLTITGAEDVEAAAAAHLASTAGTITVSASNDVTLDEVSAQNDIDIDAGAAAGDVATIDETMTLTGAGNITIDGFSVSTGANGDITNAKGNIALTASGAGVSVDVDAAITATAGNITLTASAADVVMDSADAIAAAAGNVTITAANDVTGNSTVTAQNDITISTTSGTDGLDVALTGELTTTKAGTIQVTGDKVSVGQIDSALGNIVITASNEVVTTAGGDGVDTDGGSITITSGLAVGAAGVTIGDTVEATGNVVVTATALADLNDKLTSSAGNISVTADEIDSDDAANNTSFSATAGTVTLTATNAASATVSTISDAITAKNVTLADGTFDVNGTITVSDTLSIAGDTGAALAGVDAGTTGQVVINTANDVSATTTDAATIISNGAGAAALGTVKYSDAATAATVTVANGGSTMDINDNANTSVFTVTTGTGVDNVTITDLLATSSVSTGGGADVIDNQETVAVTINAGAGTDTITLNAGFTGSADGGDNSDGLVLAAGGTYGSANGIWTNIEEIDVAGGAGGSVSISEKQLDNDGTWEYQETSGTITIVGLTDGADTDYGTISAAGLTFIGGSTTALAINGVNAQNDVITGSSQVDTIDAGTGNDTMTGGGGADVFTINTGDAAGDANGTHFDTITDWNTGGTDVIDHQVALTKAVANDNGAAATMADVVAATSKAVFDAADDTLKEKLVAVGNAIDKLANGNAGATNAGETVFFEHSGSTYVYISDGTTGYGAGDDIIMLSGKTGLASLTIVGADTGTIT